MNDLLDPELPAFVSECQAISTYAEIEEVFRSTDFLQGGAPERRVFFDDTLLFAEGARHAELRQQFRSLMSRDAMAYYEHRLLEPVIAQSIEELESQRGADGLIRTDLLQLVRVMLHRISAGITGVDGVDSADRTARFSSLITGLSEAVAGQWTRGSITDVVAEGRKTLEALVAEFLQPSLERRLALAQSYREGTVGLDGLPRDMLMTLCLAGDVFKPDDETHIPYVWRQCSLFLAASIQTTSQSVPHLIVHLDRWVRDYPEDAEKVRDEAFLRAAAVESLRLHQSSPVKFRIAAKDLVLSTGRKVRVGEMVALHTAVANRDEAIFGADARRFNPHRAPAGGRMPWGLTFGTGRHMCFGSNLVIGIGGKADRKLDSDGTLVRITAALLKRGCRLDPERPPEFTTASYHDAWETVPVLF